MKAGTYQKSANPVVVQFSSRRATNIKLKGYPDDCEVLIQGHLFWGVRQRLIDINGFNVAESLILTAFWNQK